MSKLVLAGPHGADDPTKALLPFVVATGAGRSRTRIETATVLLDDALSLLQPVYRRARG